MKEKGKVEGAVERHIRGRKKGSKVTGLHKKRNGFATEKGKENGEQLQESAGQGKNGKDGENSDNVNEKKEAMFTDNQEDKDLEDVIKVLLEMRNKVSHNQVEERDEGINSGNGKIDLGHQEMDTEKVQENEKKLRDFENSEEDEEVSVRKKPGRKGMNGTTITGIRVSEIETVNKNGDLAEGDGKEVSEIGNEKNDGERESLSINSGLQQDSKEVKINRHSHEFAAKVCVTCHQCQRNDRGRVVRCKKCMRKRYCIPCLINWYPKMTEDDVAAACPVCRGNCNCKACLRDTPKSCLHKLESLVVSDDRKVMHSKCLLQAPLPHLKQLNGEQMMERKIEATKQAFASLMDNLKMLKNFTLSRESMWAALEVLRASKSVENMTREVFQVVAPAFPSQTPAPVPALALTFAAGGSRSAVSKASIPAKVSASAKSPTAPKQASKEPIAISESVEGGFKGGVEVAPLDIQSLQTFTAVVIGGAAGKRARTFEPTPEGRVAKRTQAADSTKTAHLPFADKGKGVVELLSSALDNESLNTVNVTPESTSASIAKELCNKMFGGAPDASDPRFLAFFSYLACSTKQQAAFSARFLDDLRDSLREMLVMALGVFLEIDARNRSFQSSIEQRIAEERRDENITATGEVHGQIVELKGVIEDLTQRLGNMKEEAARASCRASTAESQLDEALSQLSSLEEFDRQRDEATTQRDEALARTVVLQQELNKHIEDLKGMALAAEESRIQQQQLRQEVTALEERCSVLLKDAWAAEDRVQRACEKCLQEYKNSPEFKDIIHWAYETRLEEYKASAEMKEAIYKEAFRMFASGYNQGLKSAKDAPSTPLADLRAPEVDSDGEDVRYGEDDNPLPKRVPRMPPGPEGEDALDKSLNDLISSSSPSPATFVTHSNDQ